MSDSSLRFEPIAVIGRGCCLPAAPDLAAYWSVIRNDIYTAGPLPADRLDAKLLFDPEKGKRHRTYANLACLTPPPDPAEGSLLPQFWRNHPEPTYRRLASVALQACRDSGRSALHWSGGKGGVYVGHTRAGSLAGDFTFANYIAQVAELLLQLELPSGFTPQQIASWRDALIDQVRSDMPQRDADGGPPLGAAVAARAVNDALRWDGPCMAFNGACASSLQALHAAVRALQLGRIDVAIAAGASYCHSDTLVLFSQAQSLSPTGSRPFDNEADGLVVGEGYVTLLLKRLSTALRDGDPVHAVIRGTSVASDGKGRSLWAPRKEGQIAAIRRAYPTPEAMRLLQYVEAHATSTQVGDATELQALQEAFAPVFAPTQRVPIGSVKANVGHTLESAGLTGLLKVLLCMEHETIPAHTRLGSLNEKIDWQQSPFFVPREFASWSTDDDGNRWAAVNGFGIGGLNAHVVISHYPTAAERSGSTNTSRRTGAARAKVAVMGVGCVLPEAYDVASFKSLLANQQTSALSHLPSDRWIVGPDRPQVTRRPITSDLGGFVRDFHYDWRRHKVPPKQIESASPLQFMILEAVDQALAACSLTSDPQRRAQTGVVVGTIFGGDFSNQLQMGLRIPELQRRLTTILQQAQTPADSIQSIIEQFTSRLLQKMPALLDETGSFTSSSLASRITKSFDLGGGAVAVDAGHGSSGAALAYCVDQLLSGDNDYMICVGAQQDMSPTRFEGWSTAGWMGQGKGGNPLSPGNPGVAPGEGCAVLLLQRVTQDQPPIATPLAWLNGLGISSGRWGDASFSRACHVALSDDSLDRPKNGQESAEPVIKDAWLTPVGISNVDEPCLQALSSACSAPQLHTAAEKVGHTGGASGMVELLAALLLCDERPGDSVPLQAHPHQKPLTQVAIGSPWEPVYSILLQRFQQSDLG